MMTVSSLILGSWQSFLPFTFYIASEYVCNTSVTCLETQKRKSRAFLVCCGSVPALALGRRGCWGQTHKPRVRRCCSFPAPLLWIWAPRTGSSCTSVFMHLCSGKLLLWHFFVFPTDPIATRKYLPACALNLLMIRSDSHTVGIIE